MSDSNLFHALLALALLLVASRLCGTAFARYRLPPVIGEILGGVLLGPTLLGALAPGVKSWIFPSSGTVSDVLGIFYQLGMLFLMFLAGAEMRAVFAKGSRKTVFSVAAVGLIFPFAGGLIFANAFDLSFLSGPANSNISLTLIIAVACAVASIPVISRIFMDLGILHTRFARIVVSIAVLEDIVLNVVIAVAVALAHSTSSSSFGAASVFGVDSRIGTAVFHSLATLFLVIFFGLLLTQFRRNIISRHTPAVRKFLVSVFNPVGLLLVMILGATGLCVFVGVTPILGAFAVGLVVGKRAIYADGVESVRKFSLGFFIPIYFAVVGLKLDLIHDLNVVLTVVFIALTFIVKSAGVFSSARATGSSNAESTNLSVALNARGGPGIVLATVAYDADIINGVFYTTLVLTAIVTSLIAGSWLQWALRRGWFAKDEVPEQDSRKDAAEPDREASLD